MTTTLVLRFFSLRIGLMSAAEWTVRVCFGALKMTADEWSVDEDQRCMRRMAEGESEALRPVFDRWKLPLLSYFYRSLASRADAEDLALQVFNRVYRAAPRYRPEAKFSTWLFAIARRELLHELRRRRRKPVEPVDPSQLQVAAGIDGQSQLDFREMEHDLLQALQELPERQRSAILLAASGDHSHAEIARTLKVTENNLNVILHRARAALRVLYNPDSS